MDTYGYLYNDPFNPSYPSQNMIASDDDSNGNLQFRITRSLQAGYTYVLVVTTSSATVTGSFWITADGPAPVGLSSITTTSKRM
jgi:hypothetical protein